MNYIVHAAWLTRFCKGILEKVDFSKAVEDWEGGIGGIFLCQHIEFLLCDRPKAVCNLLTSTCTVGTKYACLASSCRKEGTKWYETRWCERPLPGTLDTQSQSKYIMLILMDQGTESVWGSFMCSCEVVNCCRALSELPSLVKNWTRISLHKI